MVDGERILYNDGHIKVEQYDLDSHELFIGEESYLLDRGILREISNMTYHEIIGSLNMVNPGILVDAQDKGVSFGHLTTALVGARINELEDTLNKSIFLRRHSRNPNYVEKLTREGTGANNPPASGR